MNETSFVKAFRKRLGSLGRDQFWSFKVHGDAMQGSGIPDLVVVTPGRTLFLEAKVVAEPARTTTPILRTGKFTPLQLDTMKRIRQAGGWAFGLVLVTRKPRGGTLFVLTPTVIDLVVREGWGIGELANRVQGVDWGCSAGTLATYLGTGA